MSRVLVAEDSPSIRLLLVRRLEMAGHEVIEAGDGAEALAAAANVEAYGGPEIVLLDATMPNSRGPEVLNSIKENRPGLPVLMVSGVIDLSASGDWAAADGTLRKPIDFGDLLSQVERLTSGRPRP